MFSEPIAAGVVSFAILFLLIMLRIPIAVSLLTVSFGGIWLVVGHTQAISILTNVPYTFTASWTLSSIPMFLLMGFIAFHTGLTRGLFEAARSWLGWLPGGLAVATLVGAGGFSACTGSSVACSAAIGRIAVPEMHRSGYNMSVATGCVAAGGTIGSLIPPSIILILFGIQAQVSISALFFWGLVVGLSSLFLYIAVVLLIAWITPQHLPRGAASTREERLASLKEVLPTLVLIAVVFGGLFSGVFTATEAGAVGALAAYVIGLYRRTLTRSAFSRSLIDTLVSSGALFMIAVGANAFTRLVALSGMSTMIGDWLGALGLAPFVVLLLIFLIYLLLGMFLEPIGAMLLTLPIILPVVASLGISILGFGLLLAKLLEIGMITPPVGLNVFVTHSVSKDYLKLEQVFVGVLPFIVVDLLFVLALAVYLAPPF